MDVKGDVGFIYLDKEGNTDSSKEVISVYDELNELTVQENTSNLKEITKSQYDKVLEKIRDGSDAAGEIQDVLDSLK